MGVNFRFNYPTVGIYYPTVVEGEIVVLHRTIHVAVRKSALGAGFGVISALGAGFLGLLGHPVAVQFGPNVLPDR